MSAVSCDPLLSPELVAFCSLALLTTFCPPHSYGMRFIAKVLKDSLHEKFPDAGEDELLKVRLKAGTFLPYQ